MYVTGLMVATLGSELVNVHELLVELEELGGNKKKGASYSDFGSIVSVSNVGVDLNTSIS